MTLVRRFFQPPQSSFFLFGPRGTGKTTWLNECLPNALVVNLLRADTYRELSARPERLRELLLGRPDVRDVIIDEVQRVPDLLPVIHDLIESDPGRASDRADESARTPARFVLTGSSARKLKRGGVDMLAGRAVVRTLHPFLAAELPSFDLDASLRLGLLPLVLGATDPADTLRAYATLYLEQEVQAEGLVRNVGGFARFLEVVSFSHGAVLNLANVARDAEVTRKTVQGYLDVLEDLLLAFRVPVFTRRAQRQTGVHPKFYLFDAGVFRSLRPAGPIDRASEIEGAAIEGLVAQHLRAWIAYSGSDLQLSYWRTRSGVEVDFILYGPRGFWAIEVKNSTTARAADVKSLQAFVTDYPESTPLLLYRGADPVEIGGVRCLPVGEFLRQLRPGDSLIEPGPQATT